MAAVCCRLACALALAWGAALVCGPVALAQDAVRSRLAYTEAELARERAQAAELIREIDALRAELATLRASVPDVKPALRAAARKQPRPARTAR